MAAKFKAVDTFTVTGRGLVISGKIVEGVVKIGMKTRVPGWPRELIISGVEMIMDATKECDVGLLFKSEDESEFPRWCALDLKGQVLKIEDEASTA